MSVIEGDPFTFHDPGTLVDGDLRLVLEEKRPADPVKQYVPEYRFRLEQTATGARLGQIHLRAVATPSLLRFGGFIGYAVAPEFQGRRYAARACRLLFPLARMHGLNPLWITCAPDNAASRRTCGLIGGVLVDILEIPPDHEMYRRGRRQVCRYRVDL